MFATVDSILQPRNGMLSKRDLKTALFKRITFKANLQE